MKLLLINGVFEKGSTGNIVKNLFEHLNQSGHDVYVLYGRGTKVENKKVIKKTFEFESKIHHLISTFSGNLYGGMLFSTHRIKKYIKKLNPDVVNIHCANGYFVNIYSLLRWLAKNKVKTVLTMHADFMMTGGCGYTIDCTNHVNCECRKCNNIKDFNGKFSLNRTHTFYKRFKKAISKFDKSNMKILCVSPWLTNRFLESPIYKNIEIKTILNPVDQIFFEDADANPYKNDNNIVYVTPDIYDYVKCGYLLKDIALKRPDIHFTVICAKNANYDFGVPNITFIGGGASKNELKNYYHYADGTILLSKRETFSMVVAESLATGTPVYGFECGGSESIAVKEHSKFVKHGDIDSLSESLLSIIDKKENITAKAKQVYSIENIAKDYLDYYIFK